MPRQFVSWGFFKERTRQKLFSCEKPDKKVSGCGVLEVGWVSGALKELIVMV
jgi:hypothetical protein